MINWGTPFSPQTKHSKKKKKGGGCNCPRAKVKSRRFYRHRNDFDRFMQGFKSLVVMTLTFFLVFSFMGNCNSAPQVITSKNWGSSVRWLRPSFLLPSPLFLPSFSFFLLLPPRPFLSFPPLPSRWFLMLGWAATPA